MIRILGIPVGDGHYLGMQKCSGCGHIDYARWVDVIEDPVGFECPQCGGSTKELDGPTYWIAANDDKRTWHIVNDALTAIREEQVRRVQARRFHGES